MWKFSDERSKVTNGSSTVNTTSNARSLLVAPDKDTPYDDGLLLIQSIVGLAAKENKTPGEIMMENNKAWNCLKRDDNMTL